MSKGAAGGKGDLEIPRESIDAGKIVALVAIEISDVVLFPRLPQAPGTPGLRAGAQLLVDRNTDLPAVVLPSACGNFDVRYGDSGQPCDVMRGYLVLSVFNELPA